MHAFFECLQDLLGYDINEVSVDGTVLPGYLTTKRPVEDLSFIYFLIVRHKQLLKLHGKALLLDSFLVQLDEHVVLLFERLSIEWDLLLQPFGVLRSFSDTSSCHLHRLTDACSPVLKRAMINSYQSLMVSGV